MSYTDPEDGILKASRGEHYSVSGDVTIKIHISYETQEEPGEDDDDKWAAISDTIGMTDFDLVDDDDLEYEIEENEYRWGEGDHAPAPAKEMR